MATEIDHFKEFAPSYDAGLGQPANAEEIATFETWYDIKLPSDIREYFQKINGVYISDGFISIGEISEWCLVKEYEYFSDTYIDKLVKDTTLCFRFGNYDIHVWSWLIHLSSDPTAPTPITVIFQKATKVADSFTEFLVKFSVNDPESLLGD